MNYWLVKHDLKSFEQKPGWIWRSVSSEKNRKPPNFCRIEKGNKWIAYAYETGEEERMSAIVGVYEVEKECTFKENVVAEWKPPHAFVIESRKPETPLPVRAPSIEYFLKKKYTRQAVIPLDKVEFNGFEKYYKKYKKDYTKICSPLLGREPITEQELVALFTIKAKDIGVKKIHSMQTCFPDAEVTLKSKKEI